MQYNWRKINKMHGSNTLMAGACCLGNGLKETGADLLSSAPDGLLLFIF